jgi:hypothetical protein
MGFAIFKSAQAMIAPLKLSVGDFGNRRTAMKDTESTSTQ